MLLKCLILSLHFSSFGNSYVVVEATQVKHATSLFNNEMLLVCGGLLDLSFCFSINFFSFLGGGGAGEGARALHMLG